MKKYYLCLLFAFVIFICLLETGIKRQTRENEQRRTREEKEYFSIMKAEDKTWENKVKKTSYWKIYEDIRKDVVSFPIPEEDEERVTYSDSWHEDRTYRGSRHHEGCDILDQNNQAGGIPVLSMTEGTVEKIGWLELGGFRVGIRSASDIYYYYAHLDSYSPLLKAGQKVKPGQLLGYMGDSGYGREGTRGEFPVHLHLGIYIRDGSQEFSVNPYYILKITQSINKKD